MDIDLSGRPCVVTGGGRGIGRAIAEWCVLQRAPVAICGRSDETIATAAQLAAAGPGPVIGRIVDVADPEAVAAFAEEVRAELGPAHALINNAALLGPVGRVDRVDLAAWHGAMAANVGGVANAVAAFVPQMAERGGGRIVNLSGGGIGGPGLATNLSAYTASKAAVAVLTETLGLELAPLGITVNAVAPGAQPTRMTEAIVEAGASVAGEGLFETTLAQRSDPAPLDRALDLLAFLLSDAGAWITGRLLSARWEAPQSLIDARDRIVGSARFQLRRIDGALYDETCEGTSP